ncbi:hypothetical protein EV196_102406 [Mariniflexile fucanivorans]|uniref:Uncharacterized protein n=1 Tax=Mariniflexile fucanivorans TaxID=264023 RepID=A0A4R1RNF4_9FLAO|nr:hypothetical protein EV196_102406 [Mariniflexile fucanivorans]
MRTFVYIYCIIKSYRDKTLSINNPEVGGLCPLSLQGIKFSNQAVSHRFFMLKTKGNPLKVHSEIVSEAESMGYPEFLSHLKPIVHKERNF